MVSVIRGLARHPYLAAFWVIMALTPIFYGNTEFMTNSAPLLSVGAVTVFAGYLIYRRRGGLSKRKIYALGAGGAALYFILLRMFSQSDNRPLWYFLAAVTAVCLLYCYARGTEDGKGRFRMQVNALFIMGLGFCLKCFYVLGTSMYTRQNDIGGFDKDGGHAAYIGYILEHWSLPDYDPRDHWQFCHPPLHHIINAVWIKFNQDWLLAGYNPARESMQSLSLFYSMCIMISAYFILRHFDLKGMALYIPLVVINFHPAFILFSGAVNNDPLSVVFIMGAVVSVLKWQKDPTLKNILKIALCIGLGMMTKVSAAIIAPPTALVFLIVFVKSIFMAAVKKYVGKQQEKEQSDGENESGEQGQPKEISPKDEFVAVKKLILQFVCFGAVCIPLGLWYPLRNLIKWGMPLTYIQEMPLTSVQYIGDIPFIDRVRNFSSVQFEPIYEHWASRDDSGTITGMNEINPLIAILKNSLFGETFREYTFDNYPFVNKLLPVIFCFGVFLAAGGLVSMFIYSVSTCKVRGTEKAFLISFYLFMMVSFYKTCADYPFVCTMNYRYITPTAILGAFWLGIISDEILGFAAKMPPEKHRTAAFCRAAVYILAAAALIFACLSAVIYTMLCMK